MPPSARKQSSPKQGYFTLPEGSTYPCGAFGRCAAWPGLPTVRNVETGSAAMESPCDEWQRRRMIAEHLNYANPKNETYWGPVYGPRQKWFIGYCSTLFGHLFGWINGTAGGGLLTRGNSLIPSSGRCSSSGITVDPSPWGDKGWQGGWPGSWIPTPWVFKWLFLIQKSGRWKFILNACSPHKPCWNRTPRWCTLQFGVLFEYGMQNQLTNEYKYARGGLLTLWLVSK